MRNIGDWNGASGLALMAGWRRSGEDIKGIAKRIGIGQAVLKKWILEDEAVAGALSVGREAADYMVEGRIFEMALEGNLKAGELWLRYRMPDRWGGSGGSGSDSGGLGVDFVGLAEMINGVE